MEEIQFQIAPTLKSRSGAALNSPFGKGGMRCGAREALNF
jgi:hypothetical protein